MKGLTLVCVGLLCFGTAFQPRELAAQTTKKTGSSAKSPSKAKPSPKAEWRAPPEAQPAGEGGALAAAAPAEPHAEIQPPAQSPDAGPAPDGLREATSPATEPSPAIKPMDESEELLALDRSFADNLVQNGPLRAYEAMMSADGVLHDASGSSPAGAAGAQARFGSFPADVTLERSPESAMAAGGSGSSWGRYVIRRGDNQLSLGRYVTVWRREASGWLIVTELAAGRAGPQAGAAAAGPLPRKPPTIAPRPPANAPKN